MQIILKTENYFYKNKANMAKLNRYIYFRFKNKII